jgi:NMD protein affecting ribosome stability and mRNA decay
MVRTLVGKHPNYFEAIIQLRDCSKEVVDFINTKITSRKIIVTKKVELKNGFDYYCADNDQARALGKTLQERFGGEYTVTSSLHTTIDSKEKYRVTHLFREAHFRKGDVVEFEGEDFNVKSLTKDIFLQNVKTGKKIHVKFKEMRSIKKKE